MLSDCPPPDPNHIPFKDLPNEIRKNYYFNEISAFNRTSHPSMGVIQVSLLKGGVDYWQLDNDGVWRLSLSGRPTNN